MGLFWRCLQRRATASVEEPSKAAAEGFRVLRVLKVLRGFKAFKAWLKRATQEFRKPIYEIPPTFALINYVLEFASDVGCYMKLALKR